MIILRIIFEPVNDHLLYLSAESNERKPEQCRTRDILIKFVTLFFSFFLVHFRGISMQPNIGNE